MDPLPFFKCLADETRLKSLLLLEKEHELCVCELMVALDESQPKISRHLSQLRNYEILIDRRQGQWVFYSLSPKLPAWVEQVIHISAKSNKFYIKQCIQNLKKMRERPERLSRLC